MTRSLLTTAVALKQSNTSGSAGPVPGAPGYWLVTGLVSPLIYLPALARDGGFVAAGVRPEHFWNSLLPFCYQTS
jgi:hypothetical protein